LLDRYLPRDWRHTVCEPATWAAFDEIPDEEIWAVRCELRQQLVRFVRERSVLDRLGRGEQAAYAEEAAELLDANCLTLGFVRRIATYKRLYLLTLDTDRGIRLLTGDQPLQLVLAGKAHPEDDDAKHTVQGIFGLNRHPVVGGRAVFLEDLDLSMESRLIQGCDVWVNLPRPPMEASGTSGMKSVFNGGLQLSVLDGWWAEAYDGQNGWAIDSPMNVSPGEQDAHDSAALYGLLESEVVPMFYGQQLDNGMPRAWVHKIKASMKSLVPQFNTSRMVREYVTNELKARS
jgi:starch phosphorylase